ncbi:MAG: CocE/NonD family hydrolase [Spirochaetia bacterium]
MNTKQDFPYEIEHFENIYIPMSDGIQLAARLWKPKNAEKEPVPAIFEYIPYRKRDKKRIRDEGMHTYFAGHGYACIRVDIRGSGESEGILEDEYLQKELDDGVEVIRWLTEQPWCDRNVGMIGISWGGFNGLQIAALQPPGLNAVISVASTDDRYSDDVHYMGGCLLGDNLSWASTMFSYNSLPPDPEIAGERWRTMWLERLEHSGLWLKNWLTHQRRDHFWKHGSICENWNAVKTPVMAVSGWADGYTNSVFRIVEKLKAPAMGLIGPWSHKYPHLGKPGPAIGFLQEALRWWDHWLKGKDTGITKEPKLRALLQDSMPPFTSYETRHGKWVGEDQWPSSSVSEHALTLYKHRLIKDLKEDKTTPEVNVLQSPIRTGLFAGKWCSYQAPPDLPGDQRDEDGGALVFQTALLKSDIEILGQPYVDLTFKVNKPVAQAALRLSDVQPDNKATRVTYGILNLTHREGHEKPQPLVPGEKYTTRIYMNNIGQIFPKGHRIRLSVSTSYWPLAWPPPEICEMRVFDVESRLVLPIRTPKESDAEIKFPEPEAAPTGKLTQIKSGEHQWLVTRDLARDSSTLTVINDLGRKRYEEIGTEMESRTEEYYYIRDDDLTSLKGETKWTAVMERGDWHIKTITRTVLTSDKVNFYLNASLDAWEKDRRVFSKIWNESIPRDFV